MRIVSADLHASRESLDARLSDLRSLGTEQGTLEPDRRPAEQRESARRPRRPS